VLREAERVPRSYAQYAKKEDRWTCAVAAVDLRDPVGEPLARLVGLLRTPEDIGMLGPHYESELHYRLLQSPMRDTLRQNDQQNRSIHQIKMAADSQHPRE